MAKTIFEQIIDGEIPAEIVHQDDQCVAFKDVNPQAPVHILVVPRKVIPKVSDAVAGDEALLGHLLRTASEVARDQGYGDAFRLVINNGEAVGQSVFHVHVHVLAGRGLGWPPG